MLPFFRQHAISIALVMILIVATVFRLWNLPLTLQFQGDQGRDALIVSEIFTENDLVFIGPVTSVGNMYLGPLYYYFMLPFLWLTYPSPLGPAYAVAVLSILTVFFMYHWGKELIGKQGALIASLLMAFSFIAILYSRFSWNPNPAPFVSLMMIYATYKAWKSDPKYWILVALSFAILIQLHYLALLSLGGAGLIWLVQLWELLKPKSKGFSISPKLKSFGVATVGAIAIFLISLVPLMLFDWKHDWLNAKAFSNIFTGEQAFVSQETESFGEKAWSSIKETHGRSLHILFEISIGKNRDLNNVLLVSTAVILIWILSQKRSKYRAGAVVIVCYLITGIIGTALYEHTVFDHYIAYLFPVTFLTLGLVLSWLSQRRIGLVATLLFIGYFIWINVPQLPLRESGWTIYDMQTVTTGINQRLEPGEKYSLVLLSESKDLYAQNYRFFLSSTSTPALPPERSDEADTLVVINEEKLENVADLPIYEIVIFPEKNPSEVYTIDDGPEVIIFRK